MSIKVAVCGALGKMGRTSVDAICGASDLELLGLCDKSSGEIAGRHVSQDLLTAIKGVDVCLDFTHPAAAVDNALLCLENGVAPVIGTSGITLDAQERLRAAATKTPALVVPNFAIGAILMMRFAEMAAKWMPDCAVIELHRAEKPDAPSGTALHTAERISRVSSRPTEKGAESKVLAEGALGASVEGVPVHSIRLKGLLAHQEVLFGAAGETLTIRHDSLDRSSFMPGVLLAIRKVRSLSGLTVGLESLMFSE
jgi:4-hydroxy-tetrahydrodipicolinate reductase